MPVRFIWDKKYSIGNPTIDEQHRGLFEIANKVSRFQKITLIQNSVMELFKYTRYHFNDEEKMMEYHNYPQFDFHREVHNRLISRLSKIAEKGFNSDEEIDIFQRFVYDWLMDHILREDMRFGKFLQNKENGL